jgi:hypothetical protein
MTKGRDDVPRDLRTQLFAAAHDPTTKWEIRRHWDVVRKEAKIILISIFVSCADKKAIESERDCSYRYDLKVYSRQRQKTKKAIDIKLKCAICPYWCLPPFGFF